MFTPPTDSFYKFLAISGLVAMITVILLYDKYENNPVISEHNIKNRVLIKELEQLTDEFKYSKKFRFLNDSIEKLYGLDKNPDLKVSDSVFKLVIYNLPDSIKNKVNKLLLKKEELLANKEQIERRNSNLEFYFIPFLIILYGGEIAMIIGFILWYTKIEKPNQKRANLELNKLEAEDYWYRHCQSCLKTFHFKNERGLDKNSEFNRAYCCECYNHGEFIEPQLTFVEAEKRLVGKLRKLGYGRFKIWREKKDLKKIVRWYKLKNW